MNMKPMMLASVSVMSVLSTVGLYGCFGSGDVKPAPGSTVAASVPMPSAPLPPPPLPPPQEAAPAYAPPATPAYAAPAPSASAEITESVVPDASLSANVKAVLAQHNLRVGVSAVEGVVRLSGVLASSVQIDQAVSLATEVQGVREVNNQLKAQHP